MPSARKIRGKSLYLKLIINQKIDINLIKEKMCENICDEKIENLTALKFINWLLNSNQKRF